MCNKVSERRPLFQPSDTYIARLPNNSRQSETLIIYLQYFSYVTDPPWVMADAAKASLAGNETTQKTRPEKPDQAKYEADLAAAQKEHNANMEKFVCLSSVPCI